ncbi:hypothetical protein G3M48_003808 [Beauveria asiatica]|uniref:Uncharacterized protein n=1 Tax=Beauveria asiatica TaxID=1069075 RepID=A0AAW0RVB3_9HYPO
MHSYRSGPSRSTPANVQSTAQERPYVSRPSRTQQLRNPKLVPKLTNDAPNPLEKKKGAADEELAKKESERERRRALEDGDDELDEAPRRPRSPSVDSVSTKGRDIGGNLREVGRHVVPENGARIRDQLLLEAQITSAETGSVVADLGHHVNVVTEEAEMASMGIMEI